MTQVLKAVKKSQIYFSVSFLLKFIKKKKKNREFKAKLPNTKETKLF